MAVQANDPDQLAPDASLFIPPVASRFCLFARAPRSTRGEVGFRNERITADSQRASIISEQRILGPSRCPLERCELSYEKRC